jgi:hypothetical protein
MRFFPEGPAELRDRQNKRKKEPERMRRSGSGKDGPEGPPADYFFSSSREA